MKRLLIFLLLLLTVGAQGQTINLTCNFADFTTTSAGVRRVVLTPLQAFADYQGSILTATPVTRQTDTNGSYTFTNVISGYTYALEVDTPYSNVVRTIGIPQGFTGSFNATNFLGVFAKGQFTNQVFAFFNQTNSIGSGTNGVSTNDVRALNFANTANLFVGSFTGNAAGLTNYPGTNASTTLYGVVKVDGTTVVATNGVLSSIGGSASPFIGDPSQFSTNGAAALIKSGAKTTNLFTLGTLNSADIIFSGSITGNGGSLTGLNGSAVSSGTVPTNYLPTHLAALQADNGVNLTNLTATNASATVYGVVEPDNTSIVISAGKLTAVITGAPSNTFGGLGIIVTPAGGNATAAIDTAVVPQLGAANVFTGSNRLIGGVSLTNALNQISGDARGIFDYPATNATTTFFGTSRPDGTSLVVTNGTESVGTVNTNSIYSAFTNLLYLTTAATNGWTFPFGTIAPNNNNTNFLIDMSGPVFQMATNIPGDVCIQGITNGPGNICLTIPPSTTNRNLLIPFIVTPVHTNTLWTHQGTNWLISYPSSTAFAHIIIKVDKPNDVVTNWQVNMEVDSSSPVGYVTTNASSSVYGVVKVDGSTITAASGVISVGTIGSTQFPNAVTTNATVLGTTNFHNITVENASLTAGVILDTNGNITATGSSTLAGGGLFSGKFELSGGTQFDNTNWFQASNTFAAADYFTASNFFSGGVNNSANSTFSGGNIFSGTNFFSGTSNTINGTTYFANSTNSGTLGVAGAVTLGGTANIVGNLVLGAPTNNNFGTHVAFTPVLNTLLTNQTGRPILVYSAFTLTCAIVAGDSLARWVNVGGDVASVAIYTTLAAGPAGSYVMACPPLYVPAGGVYYPTNLSSGAGNSVSVTASSTNQAFYEVH